MANYANLKSTIDAQIRQNGIGAITGPVLNGVLRDMISALGEAGYLYKGVATPATSPGTPDSNVFYIASTAGTYTNFGGAVVADGEVAILKYNGTWTKEVTGAATAEQVTQLSQKVDEFAQGRFYGYFADSSELPVGDIPGFAYVGESTPYSIYNFDGVSWTDSGILINGIPVGDGEDIDYNADGKLQFANRIYNPSEPNGMGYIILREDRTFEEQVNLSNTIYEIRHNYVLTEDFTLPQNCVLDFRGGRIDGAHTLALNDCQIVGTNRWIGSSLSLSGKTSSPAFADWFADDNDASKIEKAILFFGVVNLNARDYSIDRSININVPFSLIGQSLPGNFGYSSRTRLISTAQIDCILNITKGSTYISANIERVNFTTDTSSRRNVNGINFSTPGGPSRPFGIRACNFRGMKYGIYVYGSDADHSTNLFNLSLVSCNMSSNVWGIYSEGRHGLGCLGVSDCVIEQNTQGGIYVHETSGLAMFGGCIIRNNLMEGQSVPIDIQTSGSVIIEGNYFETASTNCDVRIYGYSGGTNAPVKIFGNYHSNNGASLFKYTLSRCNVFELEDSGTVSYNVSLSYCILHKLPLSSRTKIVSCNMVAVLDEGDNTSFDIPAFTAEIYANYIAESVPSLRRITPGEFYSRNYTRTIPVGNYRCVFYLKSISANNSIYLFDAAHNVDFSKSVMATSGKVVKFVHDISVETAISGTNKFLYGFNNTSANDAMCSSLAMYVKDNAIPNIPLRAFPVGLTSGSDFVNPIMGDNFMFQGSRSVIGYDFIGKKWNNYLGMTPAISFGTTDDRPSDTLLAEDEGFPYFDTTKKMWLRLAVSYNRIINTTIAAGSTQKYIANTLTTGKQYRVLIGQFNNVSQLSIKFCKTNTSTADSIDVPITNMTGSSGTSARSLEFFKCPDTSVYPYIYLRSAYTGATFFYIYDIIKSWLTFSGEVPEAKSGTTSARPDAVLVGAGFTYFDTNLGKMIVSNGTTWVNMDGSPL